MFERLFSDGIPWLSHREERAKECDFRVWLKSRPHGDQLKLVARMRQWAQQHDAWTARIPSVKALDLPKKLQGHGIRILEVKSFQDRVLFVRWKQSAVIVDMLVKKDNWSKKEERALVVAFERAREYLAYLDEHGT